MNIAWLCIEHGSLDYVYSSHWRAQAFYPGEGSPDGCCSREQKAQPATCAQRPCKDRERCYWGSQVIAYNPHFV